MKLRATRDNYIIKHDGDREVHVGDIILPNSVTSNHRINTGTIIDKGPKCKFQLEPGDKIFFDYLGTYSDRGILKTIIPEKNVISKVGTDKQPVVIWDYVLLIEKKGESEDGGIIVKKARTTKWIVVQISEFAGDVEFSVGDVVILDEATNTDFENNALTVDGKKYNMVEKKYIAAIVEEV
jgi:co-chaperonin GroES (HSP10)